MTDKKTENLLSNRAFLLRLTQLDPRMQVCTALTLLEIADADLRGEPLEVHEVEQRTGMKTGTSSRNIMHAKLRASDIDAIAAKGGPAAKAAMEAWRFYLSAYEGFYPGTNYCGLHDPLAVALAELPELGSYETMSADIECAGTLTRGQMLPDRRPTAPQDRLVNVTTDVDFDRFAELFAGAVAAK